MARPRRVFPPDEGRVARYPKFGRFRLFERAGKRWLCRLCRRTVSYDHQWPHYALELQRYGSEQAAADALHKKAVLRRKRRYRHESQLYHERAREAGVEVDYEQAAKENARKRREMSEWEREQGLA